MFTRAKKTKRLFQDQKEKFQGFPSPKQCIFHDFPRTQFAHIILFYQPFFLVLVLVLVDDNNTASYEEKNMKENS